MLLERRSMEDLEEVLAERLALLRARRREEAAKVEELAKQRQSA
jgi:predicted transcriptional regulator